MVKALVKLPCCWSGSILSKAFANTFAQIIENHGLRSIIYIKPTRMNEWSSGKGFGLHYFKSRQGICKHFSSNYRETLVKVNYILTSSPKG